MTLLLGSFGDFLVAAFELSRGDGRAAHRRGGGFDCVMGRYMWAFVGVRRAVRGGAKLVEFGFGLLVRFGEAGRE